MNDFDPEHDRRQRTMSEDDEEHVSFCSSKFLTLNPN